jgi:polyphosphate kinase
MDSYFLHRVFPVLTPLAFDAGRPFPHISSGSLNLAVVVGDNQGTENFARVRVPDSLSRLVPVISGARQAKISKSSKFERKFVWLDILDTQLADERKSHHLRGDGHYARSSNRERPDAIDSQLQFLTHERTPLKVAKGLAVLSRKRRVADRRANERTKT